MELFFFVMKTDNELSYHKKQTEQCSLHTVRNGELLYARTKLVLTWQMTSYSIDLC